MRRLICDVCGKIHRELPDFLLPHKHYPAECIESEIDHIYQTDSANNHGNVVCAYPELSTCARWRKDYERWEAITREEMTKDLIDGEDSIRSKYREALFCCYNLLMERKKTGAGWLAECVRTAVNAGLSFCTDFAFSTDGVFAKMKMSEAYMGEKDYHLRQSRQNGGYETMQKTETSIVKWLLLEIRRVHFQDSTAFMASALGFPQKTLQSALNNAGGQRIVDVFEETMRYCVRNQLGLDAMLMRYPGAQKKD